MTRAERLAALTSEQKLELLKRLAARYPADPSGYVKNYLRQTLTERQDTIARLLVTPPYRVLVRSANMQGKTFLAACLASWFFDQFDPGVVLATAPTKASVQDLLFKELRRVRPAPLAKQFSPKAARLETSPSHFAHGIATQSGEAFQGRHERNVMLLFDEATGIDETYWRRGRTMFQPVPGYAWLATYNPHDMASPVFAAEESGDWHLVVLNGLEHPNIAAELNGLPPPIPAAIRLAWVQERIATDCVAISDDAIDDTCFEFPVGSGQWFRPEKPEFEIEVMGRWPGTAMATVWSSALWLRCEHLNLSIDPAWPVQIGCDVARFGDDKTAFAVRKGRCLIHLESRGGMNSIEVASRLHALATQFNPDAPRRVLCLIDNTGGYGSGVIDHHDGFNFVGINSAANATENHRFFLVRSELWFNTVVAAENGGVDLSRCGPLLHDLRDEMLRVKFALDVKSRRRVESKKQTKARLRRSPDLADAVNLAWYVPRDERL